MQDVVSGIFVGYCLVCVHCGKIAPHLYGVPAHPKPCRVCGRTGQYAACIVTPTVTPPDLSAPVPSTDGAKPSD